MQFYSGPPVHFLSGVDTFSGSGLLFEGFARLCDQSRILHSYHRLRREILQQPDLCLGEWPHFLACSDDLTEQRIALAQRHMQRGADAAELNGHSRRGMIDLRHVGDVDETFRFESSPKLGVRLIALAQKARQALGQGVRRNGPEFFAVINLQAACRNSAKGVGLLQNRIEDRGQIAGR